MMRNKTNAESLAGIHARMRDYKKVINILTACSGFRVIKTEVCYKEVQLYTFIDTLKNISIKKKFVSLDFKRSLKSPSSEP